MCFVFCRCNMPSQKADMNNSFRIIFIIISLIESSWLILSRSISRIPISLQKNVTFPEYSLKQSVFSSVYKAVRIFLIILLVKKQLGINFNAVRQSSTTSSHIVWVLYSPEQYAIKKRYKEKLCHGFFEFYTDQK